MNATVLQAHGKPLVLVGCGILQKEIEFLVKKNDWQVESHYLRSSLHNYLNKLGDELNAALVDEEGRGHASVVVYGACHPRMDDILTCHHTLRTEGQNCIVMLLGYERFMEQLGQGAYFLLEEWALTWEPMITEAFGTNLAVVREIFHSSHKFMVAVRTPCSGDFTAAAEAAARFVDLPLVWVDVSLDHRFQVVLPLVWVDVSLDHLESVLADAIARKQKDGT